MENITSMLNIVWLTSQYPLRLDGKSVLAITPMKTEVHTIFICQDNDKNVKVIKRRKNTTFTGETINKLITYI